MVHSDWHLPGNHSPLLYLVEMSLAPQVWSGGWSGGWRGRESDYMESQNSHQPERKAVSLFLQVSLLRKLRLHPPNAGFQKSC